MKKYKISLDSANYKKLHNKLSKYKIKIGGMFIRDFLVAHAVIEDQSDPLVMRVKRIILQVAGDMDSKPYELKPERQLRSELSYGHIQYLLLRKCLDRLVREYVNEQKVSAREAEACESVADCLALVSAKVLPGSQAA